MKKLNAAIKRKHKEAKRKFVAELKEEKTIESIMGIHYYKNLIPQSSKNRKFKSTTELKKYLVKRFDLRNQKSLEQDLLRVQTVMSSEDIKQIVVTIEWTKGSMYGNQARAEAKVQMKNGMFEYFTGDRTGGCGYCKESTAIASALNQVNGLLKKMYKSKNRQIDKSNREALGYGSGYGILPAFEGGVGVSSHEQIVEGLKMKMEHTAGGKTFDVYTIK